MKNGVVIALLLTGSGLIFGGAVAAIWVITDSRPALFASGTLFLVSLGLIAHSLISCLKGTQSAKPPP